MIFRTSYPYYVVEDGEITLSKPGGLLPGLGGPGIVIIKPYNAVVFERSGNTTRIEGPGRVLTKRFEFAKEIIDLRKQWISFAAENVLTRDHVPLTFHCGIGFRIEAAKDTAKRGSATAPEHQRGRFRDTISGDYKVYQHTLYKAVYETTKAGWQLTTKSAAETQLLNIVREYALVDLYRLQSGRLVKKQSALDQITTEVIKRVNAVSHNWGVTITGFKISSFEAPPKIKEGLFEMWAAEYDRYKLLVATDGEAKALRLKAKAQVDVLVGFEEVRTRARETVIRQIQEGLDHGIIVSEAVADRFISAIEQISRNLIGDSLNAGRYIEMLEKMAASEGDKTLIFGEERALLGPGRAKREREE